MTAQSIMNMEANLKQMKEAKPGIKIEDLTQADVDMLTDLVILYAEELLKISKENYEEE